METVRTWLAKARNEHPGSTQPDKAYRLLRVIFNVAVDDEKITANPCRIKGAGKETAAEQPIAGPEQVLASLTPSTPNTALWSCSVLDARFDSVSWPDCGGLAWISSTARFTSSSSSSSFRR